MIDCPKAPAGGGSRSIVRTEHGTHRESFGAGGSARLRRSLSSHRDDGATPDLSVFEEVVCLGGLLQ